MKICRTLKLTSDEAAMVVKALRTERLQAGIASPRWETIGAAKTAVNSYARDYSLR